MVWLFLKQPLAGVAQSPPHFLQTFLGEIRDRVSLLNTIIPWCQQKYKANKLLVEKRIEKIQIIAHTKSRDAPTPRIINSSPTTGVSWRATRPAVGKWCLLRIKGSMSTWPNILTNVKTWQHVYLLSQPPSWPTPSSHSRLKEKLLWSSKLCVQYLLWRDLNNFRISVQQRYTHLLVLDFEVMTYTLDKQRYTHLLVLDFEVLTYTIDKQRYTHLLVLDFEVMTYTIDKRTDVLDVDSTTSKWDKSIVSHI